MNSNNIFRILSIIFGLICTAGTFIFEVLNFDSNYSQISNQHIFGYSFLVLTISLFGILITFLLTRVKNEK